LLSEQQTDTQNEPEKATVLGNLEDDLIGTPLECPFNLDVLKVKDEGIILF